MREYTGMLKDRSIAEEDRRWLKVLGGLNEAQARIYVAERAFRMGRGGISALAGLTGMSRPTIMKGMEELQSTKPLAAIEEGRLRRAGAGRKTAVSVDPGLAKELRRLLDETTGGDPMSPLRWTCKSTRRLEAELGRKGHRVSHVTVMRCLHEMGYSLQGNFKTIEGEQHPDRDAQFRYINAHVKAFMKAGDPVISVDTKKKELVGRFKNAGRTWRRQRRPDRVNTHDFPHLGKGKAAPYGAYDPVRNEALVNVGMSHDTAEFAVESIRRWWRLVGRRAYPDATRLLICADAGGSNGARVRAWKVHLHRFAVDIGVPITVCHYAPGASKWNKIEHRLFSHISINWKGRPLVDFDTVVNLISSTTTRMGLKVKAVLDKRDYQTGQSFSASDIERLPVERHKINPHVNYALLSVSA